MTTHGLTPAAGPPWLTPLVSNLDQVPHAYRRRVPPELLAAITGAGDAAVATRRASPTGGMPRLAAGTAVRARALRTSALMS